MNLVKEPQKSISIIESNQRIKVVFNDDIILQIKYLCKKEKSNEWSGILFYKEKGKISEEKYTIYPYYIHLMDIGNSANTGADFSTDDSIIDLFEAKPELET